MSSVESQYQTPPCSSTVGVTAGRLSNTSNPEDKVKKKLSCDQCDFSTFNKKTLTNHTARHTGQGLHVCPHCPFNSAYLGTFKRHMIRKHNRIDLDTPDSTISTEKKDRLHCPHCPFVTIYKKNMKKHVAKHTGEGVHKCEHCNYVTAYVAGFRKHMLKHVREEVYSCPHCPYKNTYKGFFERHLASRHSEKKTFSCPQCNFTTPHKRSLKNHMAKHSQSNNKYRCQETSCEFVTDDLKSLEQHVAEHNKKDSYFCNHCSYFTTFKGLYKSHMKSQHRLDIGGSLNDSATALENNNYANTPSSQFGSTHLDMSNTSSTVLSPVTAIQNQFPNGILQQQHVQPSHMSHVQVASQHLSLSNQVEQQTESMLVVEDQRHAAQYHTQQSQLHQQHGQSIGQNFETIGDVNIRGHASSHNYVHTQQSNNLPHSKQTQLQALMNSSTSQVTTLVTPNTDCNLVSGTNANTYSLSTEDKNKSRKKSVMNVTSEPTSKIFSCKHCSYSTLVKNDLKIHTSSHSGKGLHTCTSCSFTTAYRGTFKRHMSKHSREKSYECPHCPYKSPWKGFFDRHVISKHTDIAIHQCSQCSYSTPRKGTFKRHLETHSRDKQVRKGLRYKLLQEKTQSGKYLCDHCDYSTDVLPTLKRHMMKHIKEGSFCCLQCSYTVECQSTFMKHLQKHEQSFANESHGYECSYCDYKTTLKKRYDAHVASKHSRVGSKRKKKRKPKKKPRVVDDEGSEKLQDESFSYQDVEVRGDEASVECDSNASGCQASSGVIQRNLYTPIKKPSRRESRKSKSKNTASKKVEGCTKTCNIISSTTSSSTSQDHLNYSTCSSFSLKDNESNYANAVVTTTPISYGNSNIVESSLANESKVIVSTNNSVPYSLLHSGNPVMPVNMIVSSGENSSAACYVPVVTTATPSIQTQAPPNDKQHLMPTVTALSTIAEQQQHINSVEGVNNQQHGSPALTDNIQRPLTSLMTNNQEQVTASIITINQNLHVTNQIICNNGNNNPSPNTNLPYQRFFIPATFLNSSTSQNGLSNNLQTSSVIPSIVISQSLQTDYNSHATFVNVTNSNVKIPSAMQTSSSSPLSNIVTQNSSAMGYQVASSLAHNLRPTAVARDNPYNACLTPSNSVTEVDHPITNSETNGHKLESSSNVGSSISTNPSMILNVDHNSPHLESSTSVSMLPKISPLVSTATTTASSGL